MYSRIRQSLTTCRLAATNLGLETYRKFLETRDLGDASNIFDAHRVTSQDILSHRRLPVSSIIALDSLSLSVPTVYRSHGRTWKTLTKH